MKYQGTLISVADMAKAKDFYVGIMEQEVVMDVGVHVAFKCGLALQQGYEELVGEKLDPKTQPDNFQLYFEVEDLEKWETKLRAVKGIEFIHGKKEYPWGQNVIRFYDRDKYIVEVSESMGSVVKRFIKQGMSVDDIAGRMGVPVETLKSFMPK